MISFIQNSRKQSSFIVTESIFSGNVEIRWGVGDRWKRITKVYEEIWGDDRYVLLGPDLCQNTRLCSSSLESLLYASYTSIKLKHYLYDW